MMWLSPSVFTLLLLVPSETLASAGSWIFHNHCNFAIHYMTTLTTNTPINLLKPNQIVSIAFQNKEDGSGMSVKMAQNDTDLEHGTDQLQWESTLSLIDGKVYWDISRVNDPSHIWVPYNYFAVPRNHPGCKRRICLAGEYRCKDEYVLPKDDYATTACEMDAIIEVQLCATPRGISSRYPSSISSTSSLSPSTYRLDG